MRENVKTMHEPLFHISKRDGLSWKKNLLIRTISVLAAFLVAGIFSAILIGVDPFTFIGKLFTGVFRSERSIMVSLRDLSVLLCIALALVPAFKMKFWNIGAEGQVLMGGLGCAICMYYFGGSAPDAVTYILMFLFGILFGAVWALIPAIFKAIWNTNETLFTLMMNYVAMQLVAFFVHSWAKDGSGILKNETHLHGIMLPELGSPYVLPILVAVLLTAGMYVYLRFSKHGYELSVVGESENTARYIGIDVKKVVIRTMILSGALCGLVGVLLTGAINGTVSTQTAGGQGFTAIIVAWLGKFNPLYMLLTAFLIIFLKQGTKELNLTNDAFPSIVTAIVVFIIIGCEFFLAYRLKFRRFEKKKPLKEAASETAAPEAEEPKEETADDDTEQGGNA